MRFLLTSTSDKSHDEALFAEMGKFVEELTKTGVLLATGGMELGGSFITSAGGEITVTDGPFTEAKEAVGGYALIEVQSKEEAMELSRRFLKIIGDGETLMRQLF
ncbi:YciI family protein [Yinghuangia seranimata]|uniref:YciI family protein n=1 Tax=Yinghuangia seranimata TaxID=408067 RepID=UPI00248BAB20|nr:YciI family protein [Yinghuangia seranimata]MDI2125471.1 YciI family protein [Yinghuangia seranimata]